MKLSQFLKGFCVLIIITFSPIIYADINMKLKTGEVRYFKDDVMMLNLNLTIDETSAFSGDVWLACMVPNGSIYFAPKWDEVPAPIIKNLMFPQSLKIISAMILKQTIPDDHFPMKDKGNYVFAIGISDTNTANFKVITTANTQYIGEREWLVLNDGIKGGVAEFIDDQNDAGIWLGTEFEGSLFKYYNSFLKYYGKDKGLGDDYYIFGLAYDSNNNLWISSEGLFKYNIEEDKFDKFLPPDYDPKTDFGKVMFMDIIAKDDVLWLGSYEGLCRFDGNDWHYFQKDDLHLDSIRVYDIIVAKDGAVWGAVPDDPDGNFGGVFRFDGNNFISYPASEYFGESKGFECLGIDNENCIWVGTQQRNTSLYRFIDDAWIEFTEEDGLPTTRIFSFYLDRFERFWCTSRSQTEGLSRFEEGKWNSVLTEIHGMGMDFVWKVYQDKDNNFWFGGYPKIAIRWGSD
jgi:hypothetical protein